MSDKLIKAIVHLQSNNYWKISNDSPKMTDPDIRIWKEWTDKKFHVYLKESFIKNKSCGRESIIHWLKWKDEESPSILGKTEKDNWKTNELNWG